MISDFDMTVRKCSTSASSQMGPALYFQHVSGLINIYTLCVKNVALQSVIQNMTVHANRSCTEQQWNSDRVDGAASEAHRNISGLFDNAARKEQVLHIIRFERQT